MRRLGPPIVLCALCGCSLLMPKQPTKIHFDLGSEPTRQTDPVQSSQVDLIVYDITAPAWMDSTSMYYRLAYQNAAIPWPYAGSEWVMSPSALLTQRLRSSAALYSDGDLRRVGDEPRAVYRLHSELLEWEQIFDEPHRSRGVLRLRATVEGEGLSAQRTFAIERSAPTADAAGGVSALTQCSDDLAASIIEWVSASRATAREAAREDPPR